MPATLKLAITLQKELFEQAEILAQQLGISRSQLFGLAMKNFLKDHPGQVLLDENQKASQVQPDPNEWSEAPRQVAKSAGQGGGRQTGIHQGDIYWIPIEDPGAPEPGITHPHVILQENVLNRSRIRTVVVCALTSNIKRATIPGNVLLEAGEANLPRQSVVEVSKVSTVEKTQLGEYIGTLFQPRVHQIIAGMQFLQSLVEARDIGEEK